MLKPPFTSATARQAGILSGASRRARAKQLQELEQLQPANLQNSEAELNHSTLEEIKKCSRMMQRCRSPKIFAQLAATKSTLWNLILPKIRAKKPAHDDRRHKPLPTVVHDFLEPTNGPTQQPMEPLAPDSPPAPVAALSPALPAPAPVDPAPVQTAPAPPKPVFMSEPVEVKPPQSGPKIFQPNEISHLVWGKHGK